MKGRKVAGIIILILGIIGLLLSLLANEIAVGPLGKDPGFGMQQIAGTILGVVFIGCGAFMALKK